MDVFRQICRPQHGEKTDNNRNMQTNIASKTHAAKFRPIICCTKQRAVVTAGHSPAFGIKEMSAARVNEMSNGLAPDIEFRLHSSSLLASPDAQGSNGVQKVGLRDTKRKPAQPNSCHVCLRSSEREAGGRRPPLLIASSFSSPVASSDPFQ